ncbi:MAG: PD40 domain-containing protein [Deltaproteobacteria bacterium]|nr:PD40 domain-containing protein [Deltaproteobacteria bacterium]
MTPQHSSRPEFPPLAVRPASRDRSAARPLGRSALLLALLAAALIAPAFVLGQSDEEPAQEGEAGTEEPAEVPLPQLTEGPTGPLELEIYGPTRELYRISVPPLGGHATAAQEARDVAKNDLRLSSLFRLVDGTAGVGDPDDLGIDPTLWMDAGAQGVIKGTVELNGSDMTMTLRLFEMVRGDSAVLERTYDGSRSAIRSDVHDFINEVLLYFTGIRGIFGSRILFARPTSRDNKDIFSVGMDGHGMKQWTRDQGKCIIPNWGPPGTVLYTAFEGDWAKLYRSDRTEPLLSEPGLNMGASVQGDKMAVVLTRDGNAEIYLATVEGELLARLTFNDTIDVSPIWAPGGGRIAFVSDRDGTPQIYVMNADGSGQSRVTFRGSYNQTPSWCGHCDSPTLTFAGRDGGTFDVFTVGVGTGTMRRLTQFQGSNADPTWSPDGRLIGFYSSRGGIYLMNTEGLNQNRVLGGFAETLRWAM